MTNNFILQSYNLSKNSYGSTLNIDNIGVDIKSDELTWVHLDADHVATKPWLEKEISYLDPYIIDALLVDETRPRMTQIEDGAIVILRGVNLNKDSAPEDMVSIRLWIDGSRIISLQKRQLKAVSDISLKIQQGKGPKTSGDFLSTLSKLLFERMDPVLSKLDESTDYLEEKILDSADTNLREEIVNIRKQAILFRRYIAPQRDAVGQLRMTDFTWLDEKNKRSLQESYNLVTRYVEDLDTTRERSQIIKDELSNMLSDKLNKNMYVLSVIAAIFLPLGFLTGLLGVNVGGIPGSENTASFAIFCIILTVLVGFQILLFKKFKWF